ncbi:MAG: putative LPS assembly protein LptD [Candidatus Erginobacter occultus]|nr:putative LPS assembly protein LptD [Candidatus Erginobacter occultus]
MYLDRRWGDITLNLEVQPRLNDFYRVTEKLPEVKLQAQEFQLGESDFYYQGQNSYSYLTRKYAGEAAARYESGRFDTFHQLSYSRKFFGWLNILPSASLRYDFYTRGPDRSEDPESGEETPEPSPTPEPVEERDFWRRVFSAGLGLSTDIYGIFPVRTEWLDIDRLRHVITPSVNYVFTDNPTVDSEDIYQFDSIDKINRRNYFLLTLRNRLQTKRGSEEKGKSSWTLADLTISTPLYTRPERDNSDRLIGDLSGNLKINPYPSTGLNLDLLYDSYDNRIKRDTLDLWVRPDDDWWVTFSHSYRFDKDRNQVSAEVYLRANPVWAFKVYGRYDTVGGRFEEESFTIYRDFHCWSSSLQFETRPDEDEYTFFLSFWIKEFSQAPLRLSN